ncbi:hypothetical protein OAU52_00955 [bacterium]|nr:hypothetical protein [bacterium]
MKIDNNAPIIPGISAAGISIGQTIHEILKSNSDFELDTIADTSLYNFENICLWVVGERVTQISIFNEYQGQINKQIGINSTIEDVQKEMGPISEDEDDNFITAKVPGWCFETDDWNTDSDEPEFEKNLDIEISEIFIQKL